MNRQATRAALACALVVALSGTANALHVDADGTGQVLLYPYYTVNGGQATLVTIVNSTDRTKAVAVRFRESRNGADVLRFNLYLTPNDTWTGAVVSNGATVGGAMLVTDDRSCTMPLSVGLPFSNAAYSGANRDHPMGMAALDAIERTREGFIEVIEMGLLQAGPGPTQLADEVAQGEDGVPSDCAAITTAWSAPAGGWRIDHAANIDLPTGGLSGSAAIVDVADGTMIAYTATALGQFYSNEAAPGALHWSASADLPDLRQADNGDGTVVVSLPANDDAPAVDETLPAGSPFPDAVSLALLRYALGNEYETSPEIAGATEWVITLPTKRAYTNTTAMGLADPPFLDYFRDDGESCDVLNPFFYDRAAREPGQIFCPPLVPCDRFVALCGSANVMSFNQPQVAGASGPSTILAADHAADFETRDPESLRLFQQGHAMMRFGNPGSTTPIYRMTLPSGAVYEGLPGIGFAVTRAVNAAARPGVLASYADARRHHGVVRLHTSPSLDSE